MGMGSGGFKSGTGNIPDLDVDSGTLSIDADNNRVGIGTTSPDYTLEVANPSGAGMYTIVASDTTSQAAGVGGGITFRGVYNVAGSLTEFATIRGAKSNGTAANYDADLVFLTRANGSGDSTEHMRIDNAGNIGIGTATFDGSAAAYLTIANGTEPAAATADQIYIGSKDSTGLASDGATLSLRTEAAVQATALNAVGTLSHRTSIWINGTEYYLYLDPV